MRKPTLLMTSLAAMLALGGCASSLTGDTYSRDEARAVQTVRMGTIESLRPVKIEGTKTPIGAGAGAVIGGVGGSGLGGGRGSAVLAVIGAVIITVLVLLAITAPVLARYDPIFDQDYGNLLSGPSAEHWLGTDDLGRDIYARISNW